MPTSRPPLFRLSLMMFLQYAVWGAWLPLLWPFLHDYRGFAPGQIGDMFAVGAVGALVAPFIAGQIADRYFATERFLGISHIVGGLLVWQLANIETYWGFLVFSLLYSLLYAPTLPLTNSLSFHHLHDRDKEFGKIRVWGTVGWIVVGLGIGQWLLQAYTIDDDEAARRVVQTQFGDADTRADLLSMTEVTVLVPEAASETLVGRVLLHAEGTLQLELPPVDEAAPEVRTISDEQIASLRPLYATIATDDHVETVGSALRLVDGAPSDTAIETAADELAAAGAINDTTRAGQVWLGQVGGMSDAFRVSAILGIVMGVFCFFLPHTPPSKGEQTFATAEAFREVRRSPLLMLFLLAVPISCIHQFYFVHTAGFLGNFQSKAADAINRVFGVGGGGLMTIGQMSEILVLAAIPLVAKKLSRKSLLGIGIVAYALRMLLFAYVDAISSATGIPAVALLILGVALHGFCFGCFIFVAFMIVDEETTGDVRASAQSLFNLVIVGIGIIVGSKIATGVADWAQDESGNIDYTQMFSIPMWAAVACLVALLLFYPGGRRAKTEAE